MPSLTEMPPSPSPTPGTASVRVANWPKRLAIASAVLVLIAMGAWEAGLEYRFRAKRFGVVVPGKIFRSGQISKSMFEKTLKEHGIQVVIDLNGVEDNDPHQEAEIASMARLGLTLHRFPLAGDGTGDIARYADAHEVMAASVAQDNPVLVHCSAGAQRTGGVIATYRVLVQKMTGPQAYAELLEYQWDPNTDKILLEYVNSHMRELAEMLVERDIIPEVPEPLPVVAPAT